MHLKKLKKLLLDFPNAREDYPFGAEVLVMKLHTKMYALVAEEDDPLRLTLKCDPDDAQVLRSMFPAITPGYHMNKEHWNTILLDGSVPETDLKRMIEESYLLVKKSLPKKYRQGL